MSKVLRFWALFAAAIIVGCSDDGSSGSTEDTESETTIVTPVCPAGDVKTCPCLGGLPDGVQTCESDGSAWGACDCGTPDTDADTDTDTDSDTDSDFDTDTDSDADSDSDSTTDTTDTASDTADTASDTTDTSSDTTDTGIDTSYDDPSCPPGQWTACYGDDVWCVDSGLNPQSLAQDCLAPEHCESGTPATCECTPVMTTQCYAGDVWNYNSCSGIDTRADQCEACETCRNISGTTAECRPTTTYQQCDANGDVRSYDSCDQTALIDDCATCETCENTSGTTARCKITTVEAAQQCGADGSIHWFDSCGTQGALIQTCSADVQCSFGCQNTSSVTARCNYQNNFTPCSLVTSPDRSYDICINGSCQSPGCGTAACNAPGPHFPIPDTNQRLCYNATTTMTCPTSGQAFYGQDAQYGWDVTHAATLRFTRNTSVANYPVVTDNVTGLMWQGCAAGLTGDSCATGTASMQTWESALAYCDSLSWGGYTDWRLPDSYELDSIVDLGRNGPAIDITAFPATPWSFYADSNSWSSSTIDVGTSIAAFTVSFDWGDLGTSDTSIDSGYTRCMRGGVGAVTRITRSTATANQPVVTDNVTSLIWQGCTSGLSGDLCGSGTATTYIWENALAYCENLSWGGNTDWRLPNRKELISIFNWNSGGSSAAIDNTAFPATPESEFWSSSSNNYAPNQANACRVNFSWGGARCYGPKANTYYVRCVRGGQ